MASSVFFLSSVTATLLALAALAPAHADDLSKFVAKYGEPDVDDSTAYDVPRPPIVTRMLTYKKEHVRAAFSPADAPMGSPPPYKSWKLLGTQDDRTDAVLSADEVSKRMAGRVKKRK